MPATLSKSQESAQRRENFRRYMGGLNPTAPAWMAITSGLVFEDLHGSLFKTLAARADLEPGSQQLLVGGIGSGKTTELWMADKWLRDQGHSLPFYVDISEKTDLSVLNSGALLAGLGLRLVLELSSKRFESALDESKKAEVSAAGAEIAEFAFGKTESRRVPEDEDDEEHDEGPIFPALRRDIQSIRKPLEKLISLTQAQSLDVVVIFDGLDRLISLDKFWSVVHQDFRILRQIQVAVLAAAPLSILYGEGRSVAEHFDRVHYLRPLNLEGHIELLRSVLIHRGGTYLMGPDEVDLICRSSGGVLRNLIALARDAGEAAYIAGSDLILPEHVISAVRQLGESYLRGLGPEQLEILRRFEKTRSFDVASGSNVELLVTGRVLEYSPTDFRVHPALKPLI